MTATATRSGVDIRGFDVEAYGLAARIQYRLFGDRVEWHVTCNRYALTVFDDSLRQPTQATTTTGIFPAEGPERVELGVVFDYARLMCRLIREHDQRVAAAREATERAFTELRESTGATTVG